MNLSTKSLAELQEIFNTNTKEEILAELLKDRTETKLIVSEGDRRGQLREVRETRDAYGVLVGISETTWTYWPNGNVDTITITEKDAKGKPIDTKEVKHGELGGLLKPVAIDNADIKVEKVIHEL